MPVLQVHISSLTHSGQHYLHDHHCRLCNRFLCWTDMAHVGQAPLGWEAPPRKVLIVTKLHDPELVQLTLDAANWFKARGITVFLQKQLFEQGFGFADPVMAAAETAAAVDSQASTTDAGGDAALDRSQGLASAGSVGSMSSLGTSSASFADETVAASAAVPAPPALTVTSDSAQQPRPQHPLSQSQTRVSFDASCLAPSPSPPRSLSRSPSPSPAHPPFRHWDEQYCRTLGPDEIDFVITFGGDGTVLFAAWLFQYRVPPIIPFNLGSLGFLTVFDHDTFTGSLEHLLEGSDAGMRMNFRMRFACTIHRRAPRPAQASAPAPARAAPDGSTADEAPLDDDGAVYHILNDMVIDRGPSPFLSQLELYGNEKHLTTVQADGLVIATPTGSTAYSLSAGGSVVHPDVSAILVTPICPHTLSFRPMILPDTMDIRVVVPADSRSTAWVSLDGRHRVQLHAGDSISVCASPFPVPTVCRGDQSDDWFAALEKCLAWNRRERQKKLEI
ncbi:ATP-NAD kinase-like domain-containing protein [Entophlyctis helioformis]|nr:ATP-NAD kinase-like domain-containing protein [Entophlyctis helioformis]